ncbi:transcription termination factor Rho [Luteolibacter pohnpeiensis]|uniref:Multifunctional fusion protein n=1 Tax=Luteolibacter pohnpeiensis TaxID=454153 RepID=A0A934S9A1_9BACT|nr:transcription termination factor Rho [Luteolibacter pohnpeiensis]MBK1881178.1 transcription termination factor Rho [Luteolibacter pohnpeiensis]
MKVCVLTGGIASGKSTVGKILLSQLPTAVLFDSDRTVRSLLEGDPRIREQIGEGFGPQALTETGVNRDFLRSRVFGDAKARLQLEGILHPRVRKECLDSLREARNTGAGIFIADVPLFFETGFDFGQDQVLVVASSRATQIRRLRERGGFDDSLIEHVLSAQLPVEEKIRKADVIFWNEGPLSVLEAQVGRFSKDYLMTNTNESEAPHTDVAASEAAAVQVPSAPIPTSIDINEFRLKSLSDLQAMAEVVPTRIAGGITKSQLIYELLCFYGREGAELVCEGVVEPAKENFAMLRDPLRSFRPGADDIHIHSNMLREFGIRPGQLVKLKARIPRERDKFLTTEAILEIEGIPAAEFQQTKDFDHLTPLFPNERIHLEGEGPDFIGVRLIDLIAPLGKGQRGIIVAPPRGGKTILLKQIARSIQLNHPEAELLILLLDERPEEVTDFEETVGAEVFASTFDEPAKRHAQVADLVLERAKRLVEQKKDVILLLDSLTRLARGHNSASQGGPIGSGGLSPAALQKSRKFFGTARNVEEGGSLTILATALVETESRLDDVVFEEFKGTGNMEVRLDRELAERRVFPAIHIPQSGTRNDDRLYHPDEFLKVVDIRKQLAQLPIGDALTSLLSNLKGTKTNAELVLRGLR